MEQTSDNAQSLLTEPENKLPDFTFAQLPDAMRTPLEAMGWSAPMPVQTKAIPYLLDNRDMIVQSRTGSGKTGAFLMPLLMRIDPTKRYPQALVLVPTRELAGQVYKEFEILSSGLDVRGVLVYGGVGYNAQLEALREGAQVIIGTPGRVLDHIGRRALNLDRLKIIVFDEADEMLSMGFYPDMRELRRYLPRERSSWMFSATMPYKVQMLAREFLNEPEFLSLSAGNVNISTMEHRFYDVPPLEKDLMLMRLIEAENPESAIIFCNTKVEVEYLATVLKNYGYNADQLSGDLDQKSREKAMERIRRGETRFLVATDVAARGIDISDLSHVFQYDVPKDPDSYVHRAGRTARAGNTGVVITLVANMSEKSDLKKIVRKYDIEFVELPIPTQEEAEARMAERLLVVLGDRFRSGFTRLQRERMKRFTNLIRTLAENDEERLLLAMLLDDLYQKVFHEMPPPSPDAAPVFEERRPAPAARIERDRQPSREPQREREPQPERGSRPAPQPQGQAISGDDEGQNADGGRKKKRKRKRNRNRNREGVQGGEPQEAMQEGEAVLPESTDVPPGSSDESQQPRREEPRREPRREEPRREEPRREARREEPRREEPRREEPRREPRREEPRREGPRREEPRGEEARNEGTRREDRPEQKPERTKDRRDDDRRRSSPPPSKRTERGDGVWLDSIEVIEPDAPMSPPALPPSVTRGTEVPEPGASRGRDRRPSERREKAADAVSPSASAEPARETKGAPSPAPAAKAEPVAMPTSEVASAPEIVAEPAVKPARPAKAKAAPKGEPEAPEKAPAPKRGAKVKKEEAPAEEPAPKPKRGSKKAEAPADAEVVPAASEAKPKRASKKPVVPEAPEVIPEEKPKRASKKSVSETKEPVASKRKKKE